MSEALTTTLAKPTLKDKTAVLEGLGDHPAVKAIARWNLEALTDAKFEFGELTLTIAAEKLSVALATLQTAGYNFFEDMTAVDWFPASPRFQLSYQLLSHALKEYVRVRVLLDEADPSVESITPLWPAANFYEREVFDLFGIRFDGHPNLRRILLPDEFTGHPLRKDYPVEGYR
jgi:NADH-quinone oxidoreductase subunit C